jgi:hypothetical protein
MSALFELEEFTETVWQVVGQWGLCGLCGAKSNYNQGSTLTGCVCDACATIDRCDRRTDSGDHVSHWGIPHTVDEHDGQVRGQARRRARYLKAVSS